MGVEVLLHTTGRNPQLVELELKSYDPAARVKPFSSDFTINSRHSSKNPALIRADVPDTSILQYCTQVINAYEVHVVACGMKNVVEGVDTSNMMQTYEGSVEMKIIGRNPNVQPSSELLSALGCIDKCRDMDEITILSDMRGESGSLDDTMREVFVASHLIQGGANRLNPRKFKAGGCHPTAMDFERAILMSSLAKVREGSNVLDPCCGTSCGVLTGCNLNGAGLLVGADVEPPNDGDKFGNKIHLIKSALINDKQNASSIWPGKPFFHSIVTDPPYGQRSNIEGDNANDVLMALLRLSDRVLLPGARLVFWMKGKEDEVESEINTLLDDIPGSNLRYIGSAADHRGLSSSDNEESWERIIVIMEKDGVLNLPEPKVLAPDTTKKDMLVYTEERKRWEENPILTDPFRAAWKGDVDILKKYVAAGGDVWKQNSEIDKRPPIVFAAGYGHANVVEYVASVTPTSNQTANLSRALTRACRFGHTSVAEVLVHAGAPLDGFCAEDASQDNDEFDLYDTLELLYGRAQSEADVGEKRWRKDEFGQFEFKVVVKKNDAIDLVEGMTPLDAASMFGHTGTLQLLLKHHPHQLSSHSRSITKESPFHHACRWGKLDSLKLLFSHLQVYGSTQRAMLSADSDMRNPLMLACMWGHANIVQYLVVEMCETIGEKVMKQMLSQKDCNGRTHSEIASWYKRDEVLQVLQQWKNMNAMLLEDNQAENSTNVVTTRLPWKNAK